MRTIALLRTAALAAALLIALPAAAQSKGSGSGLLSSTTAPERSRGPAEQRAVVRGRAVGFDTTKGMMAGTGAAQDQLGGDRLGDGPDQGISQVRGVPVTAGDATTWSAGDGVRSWSAKDVRAARQQQAPDLEWARAEGAPPPAQGAAAPAHAAERKAP